jgi:chromosome segregation ATPase
MERIKTLFARKGETEKKIEFLSERRAALSIQRDRSYEDMGTLEKQEADLRQQFKDASGSITKRRLTSQLLQLRKDIERRQQLLGVLNQQINVVSTHLHNLELVQQGQSSKLPDTDALTKDAVAAEEMLAQLEADAELAGTVGAMGPTGMTAEEQALYEELERESGGGDRVTAPSLDTAEEDEPTLHAEKIATRQPTPPRAPTPPQPTPRRTEPEAG